MSKHNYGQKEIERKGEENSERKYPFLAGELEIAHAHFNVEHTMKNTVVFVKYRK
jgi:hypothetical protein